jgi:iron complex outermembrane recepter protein
MRSCIISLLLVTFSPLGAQITGRIIDASNDEPVVKAMVISGSDTDFSETDGTFTVLLSESISVIAAGYHIVNIKVGTIKHFIIHLKPLNYDLSEVTITAYNNPEKLRSVAGAVTEISLVSAQNSRFNIVSSLSASPGVFIQEATPGTIKLSLRGIGSRYPYGTKKIKMFFGWIPLSSAEGETYFDDINPEYLSRIEILRGPASSIYGASLGGTVVLYPKRQEYGRSELSLISSAGSFGYYKNSITYSASKGKDDLLISLSHLITDGYRENSKYLRNSLMVNYNRHFGDKLTGTMLLSGSLITAQIPSSLDSSAFSSNPQSAAPQWLQTKGNKNPERIMTGYNLKYQPAKNLDIIGSVFGTFRKNEENRPFNFLNESGISYGGRLMARVIKNTGQMTYIYTGGSNMFYEIYMNSIYENPGGEGIKGGLMQKGRQTIFQYDIFSQTEIRFSDITLTGGFDFNKSGFRFTDQFSSDTINQSGFYNFNPVFSPRLSVSWNPGKRINTYLAVNHGFTIPTLSETLTPIGLINRDIKPEKAWSSETGARFELFRNITSIDLALYYMRVSNLIVPKRIAEDFYVGINAGASLHRGAELCVRQWLLGKQDSIKNTPFSAVLNLSYSVNRFNFLDFVEEGIDFSGNKLPGIPEQYFSGSIDMKSRIGIYSQIEILSSGKIPLDDNNSRFTDSWAVLNTLVGYSVSLKSKWEIDVMLRFNNLTNTRYSSMVAVNAPGSAARPPRYYYPGLPGWVTFNLGLKYILESN